MKTTYKLILVLIVLLLCSNTCLIVNNTRYTEPTINTSSQDYIKSLIDENKKDEYTQTIYNTCKEYNGFVNQSYCINAFVVENFKYNYSELVYTSNDLFKLGGDCKSYTLLYITLLDMLNYKYAYLMTDNHVLAFGYSEESYCFYDQKEINCISLN